jgi:hypothetical protein
MNGELWEDPIVAEVRRNREELLAEFGGDVRKLNDSLVAERSAMEAAGWQYAKAGALEARKAWHRQQREEEQRRMAAL